MSNSVKNILITNDTFPLEVLVMELKKEILLLKIEYYREELIKVGKNHGFAHSETIRLSQALDNLIVKYQKLLN
ncbi:Spo0E family sporulation regulatory protein-aspartic acid phosphatase [Heyndrickxia sp. MSNUG]|uniref:Spo0E family sporulation regulatory protein-aspartic acid phosphatase n=1 Tax=Heyndrickxia sp. MSNUG TaxID=3136677 RepID=UPI003C2C5F70